MYLLSIGREMFWPPYLKVESQYMPIIHANRASASLASLTCLLFSAEQVPLGRLPNLFVFSCAPSHSVDGQLSRVGVNIWNAGDHAFPHTESPCAARYFLKTAEKIVDRRASLQLLIFTWRRKVAKCPQKTGVCAHGAIVVMAGISRSEDHSPIVLAGAEAVAVRAK